MTRTISVRCLILVTIVLTITCTHMVEYYSILESSPYIDYGTSSTPEISDGAHGIDFGVGGSYAHTTASSDTSIGVKAIHGLTRARITSAIEWGLSGSFLWEDGTFPYILTDMKFRLPQTSVIICPDIGLGVGIGRRGVTYNVQFATFFGYPLAKTRVNLYVVPKIILFTYRYRVVYGPISKDIDYATSTMYGASLGFNFVLPLTHEENRVTHTIKVKPEISYVRGTEPHHTKISFSIIQFGLQTYYSF
ncbi:MAG: hypothetical protein JSV97_08820 [candidate division WOR-3 bacterium]|nr:MAG: hypothetical protein JSV97_08820 [candidate division WOR-3 bacterium]